MATNIRLHNGAEYTGEYPGAGSPAVLFKEGVYTHVLRRKTQSSKAKVRDDQRMDFASQETSIIL